MEAQKRISEITLISTGVLASIAISGGIIAILAHNWDQLPHSVRVILSILPVLSGLCVFSYSLLLKNNSKVWMESSSVFLMLMLGSSIGLIAQVYHMGGDFGRFLFYWMLFCVPIIYIGKSTSTALLYLLGITWWLLLNWFNRFNFFAMDSAMGTERIWYWILLLGFLPHFYFLIRDRIYSLRAVILGYGLMLSFALTSQISYITDFYLHTIFLYPLIYFIGKDFFSGNTKVWQRPMQTISIAYMVCFIFWYTFKGELHDVVYTDNYLNQNGFTHWTGNYEHFHEFLLLYVNHILLMIFMVGGIYYYRKNKSNGHIMNPVNYLFPFIMIGALELEMDASNMIARIFLNLSLLFYVSWYVYHGLKHHIPSIIAWGIFVLTALMAYRYFDMDISFWIKGILYLSLGALALLFNKLYSDKLKSE